MRNTLLAALLLSLVAATGCSKASSTDAATRSWCRLAKERRVEFDTTRRLDKRALAEFAKIETRAPAAVRADLRTVRISSVKFLQGDAEFYRDPKRIEAVGEAIRSVNRFLHDECHAPISVPDSTPTT